MQAATAQIIDAPVHQRRAHKRFDYSASCIIRRNDTEYKATVRNISEGGLNVKLDQLGALQIGKTVALEIGDLEPIPAVIRWSEGSVYGMQFLSPVSGHPQISDLVQKLTAEHAS